MSFATPDLSTDSSQVIQLTHELNQSEKTQQELIEMIRFLVIQARAWKNTALIFSTGMMPNDIQTQVMETIRHEYLSHRDQGMDIPFPQLPE